MSAPDFIDEEPLEPSPPSSPSKERRAPRTLAEKLKELADGARARIAKLQAREMRLVQDLGKVRQELGLARAELAKVSGAEGRTSDPPQAETEPTS